MTDNFSTLGLYVVADTHLTPASTVVPFVGGAAGFDLWRVTSYGSTLSEMDMWAEFHGGVKAFVRDNIAVTMEARYRTPLESFGDVGEFSLLAGLSVFLF